MDLLKWALCDLALDLATGGRFGLCDSGNGSPVFVTSRAQKAEVNRLAELIESVHARRAALPPSPAISNTALPPVAAANPDAVGKVSAASVAPPPESRASVSLQTGTLPLPSATAAGGCADMPYVEPAAAPATGNSCSKGEGAGASKGKLSFPVRNVAKAIVPASSAEKSAKLPLQVLKASEPLRAGGELSEVVPKGKQAIESVPPAQKKSKYTIIRETGEPRWEPNGEFRITPHLSGVPVFRNGGGRVLRPFVTGRTAYRGREHTVAALSNGVWDVATLLVEDLSAFILAARVWTNANGEEWRWGLDFRDEDRIPILFDRSAEPVLPEFGSLGEALSLSGDKNRWIVRVDSEVAARGAPMMIPPYRDGGYFPGAILIHRVVVAKDREPILQAVYTEGDRGQGMPGSRFGIRIATHLVLSYHDAISLAVNSRLWASVTSPRNGLRQVVRVLPRGLLPAPSATSNSVPNTIMHVCDGLDVEMETGVRQELRWAPLRLLRHRPRRGRC